MRQMFGVRDVGHYMRQVRLSELKVSCLPKCQVQSDKSEPSLMHNSRTFIRNNALLVISDFCSVDFAWDNIVVGFFSSMY